MATYTAEKLSVLVQALDSIDLPNPFHKLKRKDKNGARAGSSSLRPSRSSESFVVVPDNVREPSKQTVLLQQSISALPPDKPSTAQLRDALRALEDAQSSSSDGSVASSSSRAPSGGLDEEEQLLAWTLVGRVVLGIYGQTVDDLVVCASAWEDEIAWWRQLDGRGRWAWGGIGGYLFSTLPHRLSNLPLSLLSSTLPSHMRSSSSQSEDEANSLARSSFTPTYLLSSLFPTTSIPRSTSATSTAVLLLDPRTLLRMTRREVHGRIRHLERGRDRIVRRLGKLTVEAPDFGLGGSTSLTGESAARAGETGKTTAALDTNVLGEEMKRVLELVWDTSLGPLEHRPETDNQPTIATSATPTAFLPSLLAHLSLPPSSPTPPSHLTRPTALTRLWPPLLMLPLLIPLLSPYIPALKSAVRDARETARGFWKGWVVEPLMGIIDTVRHGGGEGGGDSSLSVMSKEGMKGDMESLERMVISLAQDKRNYSTEELAALTRRVREGDLTDVLKLYEDDIKSPLKSALTGSLVRSLLIQVQKTKVDVDFALQGIDKLLRSQELTFAFVGVAPSFLIVYLLGGWFRSFLSQAGGGLSFTTGKGTKGQRRRKSWDSIRRIERLLTLPPPPAPQDNTKDQPTSDLPYEIQGLLLVSIAGLRTVGKNEFKRSEGERKTEFMLDLLDLENPEVNREAKLRVVQRMWRCWGVRLGWVGTSV